MYALHTFPGCCWRWSNNKPHPTSTRLSTWSMVSAFLAKRWCSVWCAKSSSPNKGSSQVQHLWFDQLQITVLVHENAAPCRRRSQSVEEATLHMNRTKQWSLRHESDDGWEWQTMVLFHCHSTQSLVAQTSVVCSNNDKPPCIVVTWNPKHECSLTDMKKITGASLIWRNLVWCQSLAGIQSLFMLTVREESAALPSFINGRCHLTWIFHVSVPPSVVSNNPAKCLKEVACI